MFIKVENREQGKKVTFFSKEREVRGKKVSHTDKTVFATVSEGIKVSESNGEVIWENDYWTAYFCGKAYKKALMLKDFDRICIVEMNIRNVYSKERKVNYPKITITDFDVCEQQNPIVEGEGYFEIPVGETLLFE